MMGKRKKSGSESTQVDNSAAVALWTKGYRVTRDSPEFQLVFPPKATDLGDMALRLELDVDWPEVLAPLYQLSDRDLSNQRCLLIKEDEALLIVSGFMQDAMQRRVVAVLAVSLGIDWGDRSLGNRVARAHGLAVRWLEDATTMLAEKTRSDAERALQAGKLFPVRTYELSGEVAVAEDEWEEVVHAVRKVRGVSGVASPRFAAFPANVVLGTMHEAQVALAKGAEVDGFFDIRTLQIQSFNEHVAPWSASGENGQELEDNDPAEELGVEDTVQSESNVREAEGEEPRTYARRKTVFDEFEEAAHALVRAGVAMLRFWSGF